MVNGLRAAAEVSGAHGGGKGVSPDLPEGLHLQGADKGHQGICRRVPLSPGQERHGAQHGDLGQQNGVPPVIPGAAAVVLPDELRCQNAQGEGQDGKQIPRGSPPLALDQADAEEHHVARLRVGKHTAPAEIGVGVQQAACRRQQSAHQKGLRFLKLLFRFLKQCPSLFSAK